MQLVFLGQKKKKWRREGKMEITQGKGKILAILITGGRLGYRIKIGGDVQLLVEFELLQGLLLTSCWPAG